LSARELRECPFCGDERPDVLDDADGYFVACVARDAARRSCDARGAHWFDKRSAIAAWNARPAPVATDSEDGRSGPSLEECAQFYGRAHADELERGRVLDNRINHGAAHRAGIAAVMARCLGSRGTTEDAT
jgi:hypothetical protein